MRGRRIKFSSTIAHGEEELDVIVLAKVIPEVPGVMYLPNGDPGYPPEPAEAMIVAVTDKNSSMDIPVETIAEDIIDRLCNQAISAVAD